MKKIIIILLVIVAALAVSPFFIGSQAESKVRDMYSKASEYPNLNFEITEYNQGWFSSDVKIKLLFDVAGAPVTDEDLVIITQKMQHGPLLWKSGGLGFGLADIQYGLEFPKEIQDELQDIKTDSVSVTSRLAFDGSSASSIAISPFTLNKQNNQVIINEGKFDASVNMSGKILVDGNWQGMQVKEEDRLILDLKDLSINADQSLIDGEMFSKTALFEGDFSMGVETVDVKGYSAADSFNVNGISLTSETKFTNDLGKIGFVLGAKKISAVGQEFDNLTYDLSLQNINKQTVLAMNNLMMENSDPEAMMMEYQNLLPELFKQNPSVALNKLGVTTSVGEIDTNALIKVNGEMYDANNPMSLMAALDAKANGHAPASFFDNFGMGSDIEMMVQQNMLVRDGDNIKFDVSFKNGELLLNGAPMPMGF